MGRTDTNRIVNVEGPETLIGKFVPVRITGATATSLLGELLLEGHVSSSQAQGEMA